MNKDIKVLLVWWYTRKDLTVPILRISERFTFTGLFFNDKPEEGGHPHFPYKTIFWSQFKTPTQIINQEQPTLIIFMGIESAKVIALRLAAATCKIPCILLEHGIKNDLNWISENASHAHSLSKGLGERIAAKNGQSIWSTLLFANDGLKGYRFQTRMKMVKLMYALMKYPSEIALRKNQFKERQADIYYLLAPFQFKWYKERDGLDEKLLKSVGNIFYDDIFQQLQQIHLTAPLIAQPYALIIDQPILEMSTIERMDLYKRLERRLSVKGLSIVIKLHPDDYNNEELVPFMEEMCTVVWKKNTDIPNLIYFSNCCFGFYSTLLIPAIYLKPTFVFNFFAIPIVDEWIKIQAIIPVNSHDLTELDEWLDVDYASQITRQTYATEYLGDTDGQAGSRLKKEIYGLLKMTG